MKLLNKLTIKNLKLNKKRTIVTIIGVILSVALITAVADMLFSAHASLINFEITNYGDYHYEFSDVPIEDLKYFNENRSIENIYITQGIGYALLPESKNPDKPYIYIEAFTEESIKKLGINIVDGRLPKNDKEVVIPTHLKTNGRVTYEIGDKLTLEIGKRVSEDYELKQDNPYQSDDSKDEPKKEAEEFIVTETKEYTIVGIVERPPTSVEPFSAPGYTFATIKKEGNFKGNVEVFARYNKDGLKNYYRTTANILEVDPDAYEILHTGDYNLFDENEWYSIIERLGEAKYTVSATNDYLIRLETGLFKESTTRSLTVVAGVVCLIIIFTSVFCIKNSFDISITEKTKQYGMLSSVGATKKQIKRNVYYEAFILGLIGVPLGILCGLLASYILIIICNILLKDAIMFKFIFVISWISIIFATILGFITLYLSAWRSAHKAAKISPIEAIRNSGEIKIKAKKIKSPKLVNKMFGIGGEIAYKNIKRNKKKYRTTVISIVVCVSVFIALYSFISMAFRAVELEVGSYDYNIDIYYNNDNRDLDKIFKSIENLDNINRISFSRSNTMLILDCKYSKEFTDFIKKYNYQFFDNYYFPEKVDIEKIPYENQLTIYTLGETEYKNYLKELGLSYEDMKDKGILIDEEQVRVNDVENEDFDKKFILPKFAYQKGDKIKLLEYYTERTIEVEVGYTTLKHPFATPVVFDNSALFVVSDEYFDELFKENENAMNRNFIYIDSSNPNKLQDDIEDLLKDQSYTLSNIAEQARVMRSLFTLVAIFLYGFITVIALIGITNIFNTITTNMELRKREFAMLKSIGMTKKEFNRMIRLESFFYGTRSLIVGTIIGCLLSYGIWYAITSGEPNGVHYEIPYIAIIISVLAVLILINTIMRYSIKKINKQNTIETIRNENI